MARGHINVLRSLLELVVGSSRTLQNGWHFDSVAGLHVCALFRDPTTDDRGVADRAGVHGVRVEALSSRFREQPAHPGLSLGFGGIDAEAVPDAMRLLERAVRDQLSGQGDTPYPSAGV